MSFYVFTFVKMPLFFFILQLLLSCHIVNINLFCFSGEKVCESYESSVFITFTEKLK